MQIHKARLRPGRSFPLRSSFLHEAIMAACLKTPIELHQRCETWWTEGVLFRADFYPPTMVTIPKGETLHITCRSVLSSERQAALAFLEEQAIPAFIEWLTEFEGLPANSTVKRDRPSFVLSWGSQA
jgi:hypothetical protein